MVVFLIVMDEMILSLDGYSWIIQFYLFESKSCLNYAPKPFNY
jgi:hypothetical protein